MEAIFTRTVSDREVRDIILCARERARTRLGMRLRARLRGENLKLRLFVRRAREIRPFITTARVAYTTSLKPVCEAPHAV